MGRLIKNFTKYRYLLGELVKKDIKLKYRRSYLGILWTMIEPLLTMIVLAVVFGTLLGRKGADPRVPFAVYILTGRLLYSFFSSATKSAMKSIRANSGMIKKVYVPKYMYPLSGIISNFVIFLISLIVLVAVIIFFSITGEYQVPPSISIVGAIIPLIILFILSTGVGLILSTMAVFFRDLEYLWSVLLMLIMYCSAIFYYASTLGGDRLRLIKINPLFGIIENFRRFLFGQGVDMVLLGYTAGISLIALLLGIVMFYKQQDKFILNI